MDILYIALVAFGVPLILAIFVWYRERAFQQTSRWRVPRKASLSEEEFVKRLATAMERPLSSNKTNRCAITWDFWALLSDPLLTRELQYRFWHEVSPTVSKVDAICVLSLAAAELIRPLTPLWKKRVLVPSQLADWARSNPNRNQIAVVDIAIHAGYTLTMAMDRAADAGLCVRYVWLAMYNDLEESLPHVQGMAKSIIGKNRQRLVRVVLLRSQLLAYTGYTIAPGKSDTGLPEIKATPEVMKRARDLDSRVASAFSQVEN